MAYGRIYLHRYLQLGEMTYSRVSIQQEVHADEVFNLRNSKCAFLVI